MAIGLPYHFSMCNVYRPPETAQLHRVFDVDPAGMTWPGSVHPRAQGPFIRRAKDDSGYSRELVVGQWALIPPWAKEPKLKFSTNNARSEELADKASFREVWKRGQRCIIPAMDFDEPNWETGKNQWWRFKRADGDPWALAGLWNTWMDRTSGDVFESYTMLTINADSHPLMSRMHKSDPKLPPDQQDKRSVIPIEMHDIDKWLAGTVQEARTLLTLAMVDVFDSTPI